MLALACYAACFAIALAIPIGGAHPLQEKRGPVQLIVDTDMGGGGCRDVDDVVALCVANALADAQEAKLLAVMVDTLPPEGVVVASKINEHYGRGNVPIGAYKTGTLSDNSTLPFVTELLRASFPSPIKNVSEVPSAVDVYRRVLAKQADHSVVISAIGLLTNLEALMRSPGDEHSALSGYDLFATKVRLLAVMGGHYSPGLGSLYGWMGWCSCNFCGVRPPHNVTPDAEGASTASAYVINNLPPQVKVVFFGITQGLWMGRAPLSVVSNEKPQNCTACPQACSENPCRTALNHATGATHLNWDPLVTLMAVRGVEASGARYCRDCDGYNFVDDKGNNHWKYTTGHATNQSYLEALGFGANPSDSLGSINNLLCQKPTNSSADKTALADTVPWV